MSVVCGQRAGGTGALCVHLEDPAGCVERRAGLCAGGEHPPLRLDGSGKLRKIIHESTGAAETYLAHQLPDQYNAIATPVGLLVLLLAFDWRLGLLSLAPVMLAFLIMATMTGKRMAEKMRQYGNALEAMSNEAVEYVRGIPVVKTFGQSVFSFKKFKATIDEYEKWVISYTKGLRLPMMFYTVAVNGVVAEQGAPDALYAWNGQYTHMVDLQTESQSWVI